jgi:hypothetical protein
MSETIPPPLLEAHPAPPVLTGGEREYRAFLRLLPELLPQYEGKFVAIHNEQVIDSDSDDIALIQRVHARVGYVPIHVGLVSRQPTLVHIPHYRAYRPRGTE